MRRQYARAGMRGATRRPSLGCFAVRTRSRRSPDTAYGVARHHWRADIDGDGAVGGADLGGLFTRSQPARHTSPCPPNLLNPFLSGAFHALFEIPFAGAPHSGHAASGAIPSRSYRHREQSPTFGRRRARVSRCHAPSNTSEVASAMNQVGTITCQRLGVRVQEKA